LDHTLFKNFQEVKMSPSSILVAYVTTYGSTQEVAQSVAETLRGFGLEVEVQLASKVKDLAGYRAVVLGAPLYMFRWHPDARHFLTRHRAVLASLPPAIFALGPFHNQEEELRSAREQLDKELAKFPWLKPLEIEVFVGKFDPNKLRFPYSLIGPLKKMPASDERDWSAIEAWANRIAEGFQVNDNTFAKI
jgi:menaquinone-dependent protoporphyrinogen oxidase